jgi:ribosomal protein S18 acetylase RimI-like enzyme
MDPACGPRHLGRRRADRRDRVAHRPGRGRGSGIGTLLLERLEQALAQQAVEDIVIGVLPGNDGALRLHGRHGYRPTWMYVSRFRGR